MTERVGLIIDLESEPAKGEVKDLERTVDRSANEMTRDMKRVQRETDRVGQSAKGTSRSMLDAGAAGSKMASITGAGLSSMAAGFSAASASAENLATTGISVASSLAAAFAAGGPVGLGIAALTTAAGFLFSSITGGADESAEALKRMREEAEKGAAAATLGAEQARERYRALTREVEALQARLGGFNYDSALAPLYDGIREAEDEVEMLRTQYARLSQDISSAVLDGASGAMLAALAEQQGALEALLEEQVRIRDRARERLDLYYAIGEQEDRSNQRARLRVEYERRLNDERARALEDAREYDAIEQREVAMLDQVEGSLRSLTAEQQAKTEALGGYVALYDQLLESGYPREAEELRAAVEASQQRREEAAKLAQQQAESVRLLERQRREEELAARRAEQGNRALETELRLLEAGSGFERERIRILERKNQLLEQGLDAQLVEEVTARKLAEVRKDELEAEERALGIAKERQAAEEATTNAIKSRSSDPVKQFQNFGGTSLFGFGRGQVGQGLGSIATRTVRRRISRVRPPQPGEDDEFNRSDIIDPFKEEAAKAGAEGGKAAAEAFKAAAKAGLGLGAAALQGGSGLGAAATESTKELPDPTPAIEGVGSQHERTRQHFERITQAAEDTLAKAAAETKRIGEAAAAGDERLHDIVRSLAVSVRALERRLAAAGTGGR